MACFNSQPPEGGWIDSRSMRCLCRRFNSQPPEGGWVWVQNLNHPLVQFQLTAARRRLDLVCFADKFVIAGFNSQPPEGGWSPTGYPNLPVDGFNSQPPEGGWRSAECIKPTQQPVSTHSRPKAAGGRLCCLWLCHTVSTHSRPKAAG